MKDQNPAVTHVVLGIGLALLASGALVMAQQVGTGPAKGARQPDFGEPCCSITNILSCAVPPNSGTGASGNAATGSTGTLPAGSQCGSNVSRNANTKTVKPRPAGDCHARTSTGVQVEVACPLNVPIKPAK